VAVTLPDATTRWRCARCGNLTRFDVSLARRTREFWHLDLGGEPTVAETEVVTETVEQVRCRWCDAVDAVELVPRPAAGGPIDEPGGPGTAPS
jgi:hypothetical protein